jgi:hypothetical protein
MAMKLVDLASLLRPRGKQLETVGKQELSIGPSKISILVITIVMRKNPYPTVLALSIGLVPRSQITDTHGTLWRLRVFLVNDYIL